MTWFLLTMACIILWGVTDILHKVSLDAEDPLSHYKTFVWIGIAMALAGGIMTTWSTTLANSAKVLVNDLLFLFPLGIAYAAATFMDFSERCIWMPPLYLRLKTLTVP